jgi:hypothetical protein
MNELGLRKQSALALIQMNQIIFGKPFYSAMQQHQTSVSFQRIFGL